MRWLNHLKIQSKLFIAFGILVGLMLFSNLFAISQFVSINREYNTLITTSLQRLIYLNRAVEDITSLRLHNMHLFEGSLHTGTIATLTESFLDNITNYRDSVMAETLLDDYDLKMRLNIWNDIYDSFVNTYIPYQSSIEGAVGDSEAQMGKIVLQGIRIASVITERIEDLRHATFITIKKKSDEITAHFYHIIKLLLGVALCIVVFSILLSALITKTVRASIVHIQDAMVEISKGNLNYPIRSEFRDELGRLTHDIGDMIDNITEMNKTIAVMEHLDAMICISDANYHLVYMNDQMAEAYGLDKESCLHQKCYAMLWQRDDPCPHCLLPHIGEKGVNQSYVREHFWDETLGKWLGSKSAVIPWIDGSLVQFTSFTDETANKVQEELRQEKMVAEAASKSKSDFLAAMSHEIRTPMNAVLGITEMLLENETFPRQETKEGLHKIYHAGDLLLGIINDILDLSKIEAGKLELLPDRYDVASLINDVVQLNVMRIGSKPIRFALELDENTPAEVVGDALRVKQILNNVLSNAFKYTAEGRVTLTVTFERGDEAQESEATLVFRVSDTGQGMTAEQVSHLGDEYARFNMEANRTTEGTGLGMNITRNLVRMMNGRLSVESEPGKGSTFTVRLPQQGVSTEVLGRELVENMKQFRISSKDQMKRTQISREPMPYGSVLIVDDVETNLYVARGLMSSYKLRIDTASSGFEALDKIRAGKTYDIVFMDHMMPKMDGMETTKILRDMEYALPIVALSANAVAGQMEVFLASGFDDFISKPIDIRQLNIVLNRLIRDKQTPEVLEAARREAGDSPLDDTDDGQPRVDPLLAASFVRDATKAIAVLEAACGNGAPGTEESIHLYTIDAHAMKSALANIGEAELSKVAFRLEQAGRGRDLAAISSETPAFLDALRAVILKLTPKDEDELGDAKDEDQAYLREKLLALHTMCAEYDIGAAESALAELRDKTWSRQTRERLNAITEHLLHSDLDEAASAAKGYAESMRAE